MTRYSNNKSLSFQRITPSEQAKVLQLHEKICELRFAEARSVEDEAAVIHYVSIHRIPGTPASSQFLVSATLRMRARATRKRLRKYIESLLETHDCSEVNWPSFPGDW